MNTIEVCLTPALIDQFDLKDKIVVVVDIFRATSCMVAGMGSGVKSIYPVAAVEECFALGKEGKIMAGERGGIKVEGFDIGNSPFHYMDKACVGMEIAVTTTNGTLAISKSIGADEILIGAFLNISAISKYLSQTNKNIIVHCAGWKGTVNLEDTLFAGALIDRLIATHDADGDPALVAACVYHQNKLNLVAAAETSSHAKRLSGFGAKEDLAYCMTADEFEVVPSFKDTVITNLI